jgi:hypothetical protein
MSGACITTATTASFQASAPYLAPLVWSGAAGFVAHLALHIKAPIAPPEFAYNKDRTGGKYAATLNGP